MASNKTWIILGALFAVLLGATPAAAGVAIDNAVMLDPYDPVPPIQFHHWYGACDRECGGCQSCYHRASCDDGCYRERCDNGCGRCEHDCDRDRCDRGCTRDDCDRDCGHDCNDRGCDSQQAALPCNTGDCYESERWEHRFRDGTHVTDQWYDSGQQVGEQHHHHHFSDDDDDDQDGPPPH